MALSHAALADHDEVLAAADELAGGELLDLRAVDGRGVERPVEILQILVLVELGVSNPPFHGPPAAARRRLAEDQFQEAQVRQPLLLGARQRRIERLRGDRHLEGRQVAQNPFTKVGCKARRRRLPGRRRLFLRCRHREFRLLKQ